MARDAAARPCGDAPGRRARDGAAHRGRVVAAHGRHVVVETGSRVRVRCHLRSGRRNAAEGAAVVGDFVAWRESGDEGVVESVLPRRNLLRRQDAWRAKSFAANLDAVALLVAPDPPFADAQLTRALIAAHEAGVPPWIGLNKADLPGINAARTRLAPYAALGVPIVELALKARPDASRDALEPFLRGRTTLVIGPSGMGKSTLINLCVPDAQAQVGELSRALNAGRHTTTTTTWYWLGADESDGALIDSPGFQEFGLHHIAAADLAQHMPDLAALADGCRFNDCTHRDEPGCAVRAAVDAGTVAPQRYRMYLMLHDELSPRG